MDKRQEIATTSYVSDRTPRPLLAPLMTFDLAAEVQSLRAESAWRDHGHNARTLIKHSEFRLVLMLLAAGVAIDEQSTDERLALQAIFGRLRLHVPTENVNVRPGRLVALDRKVPYALHAEVESHLLLWVGWSGV